MARGERGALGLCVLLALRGVLRRGEKLLAASRLGTALSSRADSSPSSMLSAPRAVEGSANTTRLDGNASETLLALPLQSST